MKKQVFNPYLPLWEYVPDGEPHLFDGRVYLYGSHDAAKATAYCPGDYVVWSAPETDLSDWRCEGITYRRTQDPSNADNKMQLWAPDVTRGPDGRYYLYYCFSFYPEFGVAVSDSPAGPFEFYGHVKYPDHINGGKVLQEFMPFDPAVLTDDDGRVYLYYGFAPACEKEFIKPKPEDVPAEFRDTIDRLFDNLGENGMVVELEPDMLTIKEMPRVCVPGGHHTAGTGFEGHGYFEAPSIRKIGGKYYLLYSSHKSHELCYAVSDYPDRDFRFGGIVISNGDVGLEGRKNPVYLIGNNHGGLVPANGEYYIFYHRQTHGTEASRQGCAEKVTIAPDGSIRQVEITSCGLNGGPLEAKGSYSAAIACHLTSPTTMDYIDFNNPIVRRQTRITSTNGPDDCSIPQYITDIGEGTVVGFKYFRFENVKKLSLSLRGSFQGEVLVTLDEKGQQVIGRGNLTLTGNAWEEIALDISADGVYPLYLHFRGEGKADLESVSFPE